MARDKKDPEGSVRTHHLEGKIIETIYEGYISVPMITQVLSDMTPLLRLYPGADWLINSIGATGIAPAPHNTRMAIFDTFKKEGGGKIAGIVRSAPMRMIAVTLGFAFGLPLKIFETRLDALTYLREGPSK